MPKHKTKARRDEINGDGPTPERMTRDQWDVIAAPKLADEDWRNRTGKARKVMCRIDRMRRDGWINANETRGLLAYQALMETAGYDRGRSCIDFGPRGDGRGLPPMVVAARDRLAAYDFALLFVIDKRGLKLVKAVLGECANETINDVAALCNAGLARQARLGWAKLTFKAAGQVLAGYA